METTRENVPALRQEGNLALKAHGPASGEYLTFRLGAEEYGIDILKVQEIRSYEPPTRIANAPEFIKGVVNLRGVIVPIVDLRLKLGCPTAEYNSFTVVIVLNVRNRVVGAVVDSVSDVLELNRDAIRPAPASPIRASRTGRSTSISQKRPCVICWRCRHGWSRLKTSRKLSLTTLRFASLTCYRSAAVVP